MVANKQNLITKNKTERFFLIEMITGYPVHTVLVQRNSRRRQGDPTLEQAEGSITLSVVVYGRCAY